MRLREAIRHAEEVAKGERPCAKEHAQLARWLRELQEMRATAKESRKVALATQEIAYLECPYAQRPYCEHCSGHEDLCGKKILAEKARKQLTKKKIRVI